MKNYKCNCYYIETDTTNINTNINLFTNTLFNNEVYIKDLRVVDNSSTSAEKNINVWLTDGSIQTMLSVRNQKIIGGEAIVLSKKNIPLKYNDKLQCNFSNPNIGISFSILSCEN